MRIDISSLLALVLAGGLAFACSSGTPPAQTPPAGQDTSATDGPDALENDLQGAAGAPATDDSTDPGDPQEDPPEEEEVGAE